MKRRDFLHISAVTGLSVSLAGANNLIASPQSLQFGKFLLPEAAMTRLHFGS